jgi:hypothetical protein
MIARMNQNILDSHDSNRRFLCNQNSSRQCFLHDMRVSAVDNIADELLVQGFGGEKVSAGETDFADP